VVFLLDASGSVGRKNFQRVTRFVAEVVEVLELDRSPGSSVVSRVGLVTFGDIVTINFYLDTFGSSDDVLQAVNVRYMGGATCTQDAIRYDVTFIE